MGTNPLIRVIDIQLIAGSISSIMFVISTLPMVWKALKTKDLKSYSLGNIVLSNLANIIYWIYVTGLPFGPVWYIHVFNTLITLVMLILYFQHELGCKASSIKNCYIKIMVSLKSKFRIPIQIDSLCFSQHPKDSVSN